MKRRKKKPLKLAQNEKEAPEKESPGRTGKAGREEAPASCPKNQELVIFHLTQNIREKKKEKKTEKKPPIHTSNPPRLAYFIPFPLSPCPFRLMQCA